ncbi:MAG: AMP-binding protein [Pseudomonadota bacterium]
MEGVFCGAAPISKAVFNRFEETTGTRLLEGYGFTEGGGISAANPPHGERRVGSVGLRMPYQEVSVFVEDENGGYRKGDVNEIGIIGVRGDNIFKGYVRPEDNAAVWIPDPDGGTRWYNTGDMGRIDKDEYIWLTGRKKELIIRGGHNIDPATIEEALSKHPDVDIVAAIPSPDAKVGEIPIAYATKRPGAVVDEATLLKHLQQHITERAATPKRVIFVDEMPLTAIGKIFKPELKRIEINRVITEVLQPILGSIDFSVRTISDKTYGQCTNIKVAPNSLTPQHRAKVEEALLNYPIEWAFE